MGSFAQNFIKSYQAGQKSNQDESRAEEEKKERKFRMDILKLAQQVSDQKNMSEGSQAQFAAESGQPAKRWSPPPEFVDLMRTAGLKDFPSEMVEPNKPRTVDFGGGSPGSEALGIPARPSFKSELTPQTMEQQLMAKLQMMGLEGDVKAQTAGKVAGAEFGATAQTVNTPAGEITTTPSGAAGLVSSELNRQAADKRLTAQQEFTAEQNKLKQEFTGEQGALKRAQDKALNDARISASDRKAEKAYQAKLLTMGSGFKPTEFQSKAFMFHERIKDANASIVPVEKLIIDQSFKKRQQEKILPTVIQSEEWQKYVQAENQWIEANLRLVSGAAIAEHEYENYRQTYFIQPGDDKPTIIQKQRARAAAEGAITVLAGPLLGGDSQGGATKASGPTVGTVEDGYRFKGGDPADQNNWEKVQ